MDQPLLREYFCHNLLKILKCNIKYFFKINRKQRPKMSKKVEFVRLAFKEK